MLEKEALEQFFPDHYKSLAEKVRKEDVHTDIARIGLMYNIKKEDISKINEKINKISTSIKDNNISKDDISRVIMASVFIVLFKAQPDPDERQKTFQKIYKLFPHLKH